MADIATFVDAEVAPCMLTPWAAGPTDVPLVMTTGINTCGSGDGSRYPVAR